LQLIAHPETSEWFSITSGYIFKVNMLLNRNKQKWQTLFFISLPSTLLLSPALPLFPRPWNQAKKLLVDRVWYAPFERVLSTAWPR